MLYLNPRYLNCSFSAIIIDDAPFFP